jgi:hypothetical protein
MNERILELMKQADYPAPEMAPRAQRLAELIVRECAMVAEQWVNDEDNGRNLVSDRLKQHFGVEE